MVKGNNLESWFLTNAGAGKPWIRFHLEHNRVLVPFGSFLVSTALAAAVSPRGIHTHTETYRQTVLLLFHRCVWTIVFYNNNPQMEIVKKCHLYYFGSIWAIVNLFRLWYFSSMVAQMAIFFFISRSLSTFTEYFLFFYTSFNNNSNLFKSFKLRRQMYKVFHLYVYRKCVGMWSSYWRL